MGGRKAARMVNCPDCFSTIITAIVNDTSNCTSCGRVIVGTKVVTQRHDGTSGVYCPACASTLHDDTIEDDRDYRRSLLDPDAWRTVSGPMLTDADIEV